MRIVVVLGLVAALFPAAAVAQSESVKGAASGERITKEQYLDRAKERATKRFEKLDTNHDGVLSSDERRASRRKKSSQD
jgi:hypothetical protein